MASSKHKNKNSAIGPIPKKLWTRIGWLVLGIVVGQIVLYGASFTGTKILLPLDALTLPLTYIPLTANQSLQQADVQFRVMSDPVFEDEPARLFGYDELHAGRLPIWNPYQYAGVPSVSFLSPFAIFAASVRSPLILPWLSLALALVGGLGVYVFLRDVFQLTVWPATIAAWCYPVTGFFVLWQSASLSHPVVWLPWLLWSIHAVLAGKSRWALAGVALTTALTIVSGHLDMAGLALIAAGLFALWDFIGLFRGRLTTSRAFRTFGVVVAGWIIGFMLASPELLPALAYTKTGARLNKRGSGQEERPPIGLVSLPQIVLPHMYGTLDPDSFVLFPKNERSLPESPAAGFTGLLATLLLAPFAWGLRRLRSATIFFALLGFLGMAWSLDLPVITWLMRLPPLNMLSYNRFVFITSFAILTLAAIGLEEISRKKIQWHQWYYVPAAILAFLLMWCLARAINPPHTIAVDLPQAIAAGQTAGLVQDMAGVQRVQHWFLGMYLHGALVCLLALIGWIYFRFTKELPAYLPLLVGGLALFELLFAHYGEAPQADPKLYYPSLPALDEVANTSGRVLGYKSFPANLLQTKRLPEIRGYDGVDPQHFVELVNLAAGPDSVKADYAALQFFVPNVVFGSSNTLRFPPVLDLLGVRRVIVPNQDDTRYLVYTNESALPRAFVPQTVELETNDEIRLAKLGSAAFDPRKVAYVEEPLNVNSLVQGQARIVDENPQRITIAAKMNQNGLVVLADQWNSGWRASIGDKEIPILRVDHALRGVLAPAGESTIVFRYQPQSLRLGLVIALVAVGLLILESWTGFSARQSAV